MLCESPFFIIVSVPEVATNLTVVPLVGVIGCVKEVLPNGDVVEVVPNLFPPNGVLLCCVPPNIDEEVLPKALVVDWVPNVLVFGLLALEPNIELCVEPNNG